MEWSELIEITKDEELVIERIRVRHKKISIEGCIELPPLSRLSMDDQIFIAQFIKCHGSIKDMERLYKQSYPTIKNKLNRLSQQLSFAEVQPVTSTQNILDQLERGELSAEQAAEQLKR